MEQKRQSDCIDRENTPTKPASKRMAVEGAGAGGESGGSSVARPLDFVADSRENAVEVDRPPSWFLRFFEGFEKRLDEKITKRLDEVCLKVKEHDEIFTACSLQIDNLEKEIRSPEEREIKP